MREGEREGEKGERVKERETRRGRWGEGERRVDRMREVEWKRLREGEREGEKMRERE